MVVEVEVGGDVFRVGILNAKQQLHIVKRILPIFVGAATPGGFEPGPDASAEARQQWEDDQANRSVKRMADVISQVSDEDLDYIMDTALSVVQRKQGDVWSSVMHPKAGLMFQDLKLATLVQLTVRCIQENCGDFLYANPLGGIGQTSLPAGP